MSDVCITTVKMNNIGNLDLYKEVVRGKDTGNNAVCKEFDYNKLIPMPESLDMEDGSVTVCALVIYITDKLIKEVSDLSEEDIAVFQYDEAYKKHPIDVGSYIDGMKDNPEYDLNELYSLGEKYVDNIKKYGCPTWYKWRIDNWGVKWNAYYTQIAEDGNSITFSSPWNPPYAVIEALSKKYPDEPIDVDFELENGVKGHFSYKSGVRISN